MKVFGWVVSEAIVVMVLVYFMDGRVFLGVLIMYTFRLEALEGRRDGYGYVAAQCVSN